MDAKSLADTKWFDLFHDDTLTQLVNTALQQNFDLQIAAERVLEARAQLGVIQAARLPNIDATGGFQSAAAVPVSERTGLFPRTLVWIRVTRRRDFRWAGNWMCGGACAG